MAGPCWAIGRYGNRLPCSTSPTGGRVPLSRPRSPSRHGPAVPGTSVRFRVLIDGKPPGAAHGIDVDDQGNGTVTDQRLHQLIRQAKRISDRQFEIELLDSGVEAFAFTFG